MVRRTAPVAGRSGRMLRALGTGVGAPPLATAGSLCVVQGEVSRQEEVLNRLWAARVGRDPHARADLDRQVAEAEGGTDVVDQSSGESLGVWGSREVPREQDELVPAEAHGKVVRSGDAPQPAAHLSQHLVARAMTQRVVDVLEVVEVDQQERRRAPTGLPACEAAVALLGQDDPGREGCELVVPCQPVGLVGLAALGRTPALGPQCGRQHVGEGRGHGIASAWGDAW